MRSKGKAQIIVSFFIWLYPVFLILLSLWGWIHYGRLPELQAELEKVQDAAEAEAATDEDRWGSEDDIRRLRELVGMWREKAVARAADVPVLLENAVRDAGWELTEYHSRGSTTENGSVFARGEINARGTEVFSLLSALENHPEKFIKIPSLTIRPNYEGAVRAHEVRMEVHVLVE